MILFPLYLLYRDIDSLDNTLRYNLIVNILIENNRLILIL